MSDFWTIVLAVITGCFVYELIGYIFSLVRIQRESNHEEHNKRNQIGFQEKDINKKRDTYSPEVSGRRAIGFRSCEKEEQHGSDDQH